MQTFIWIVCTYLVVQMICYWIFEWDYKTRLCKLPQFSSDQFPWARVFIFYASVPGLNLFMLFKVVRSRIKLQRLIYKARRNKRHIAHRLRERAEYYKSKGDASISEMFLQLADKIENSE